MRVLKEKHTDGPNLRKQTRPVRASRQVPSGALGRNQESVDQTTSIVSCIPDMKCGGPSSPPPTGMKHTRK